MSDVNNHLFVFVTSVLCIQYRCMWSVCGQASTRFVNLNSHSAKNRCQDFMNCSPGSPTLDGTNMSIMSSKQLLDTLEVISNLHANTYYFCACRATLVLKRDPFKVLGISVGICVLRLLQEKWIICLSRAVVK